MSATKAGKVSSGSTVRLLTDVGDALKGDEGIIKQHILPRGRGYTPYIIFDDGVRVALSVETPVDISTRKNLTRKYNILEKRAKETFSLGISKGMDYIQEKPKRKTIKKKTTTTAKKKKVTPKKKRKSSSDYYY